jgi:hypothetical protein
MTSNRAVSLLRSAQAKPSCLLGRPSLLRPQLPTLHLVLRQILPLAVQGWVLFAHSGEHDMGTIINMKKRAEDLDFKERLEKWELEEAIHQQFMKRHDLMWKRPIVDEEITKIDMWLLQHKLPMDILIGILARTAYVEWIFYGDLSTEQKHTFLIHLRECYREFQKLPPKWQETLWPMMWGRWRAEFADEEEEEARANG